ncbi:hypothetical protein DCC39_09410 [Pueribacillus theae]|uniref:Uncharacterized protein n=1 Tax=Pueribacillus theae TaxID=2171751 RepID=A0A2U1K122_9BACI|nr:hypothetical protein [Pueribacillus theae]PWA11181.1 hypothetical protein DCC39_09410 [Pueribacillus theae]
MKLVIQAIVGSIIIHAVYFIGAMLVGDINTKRYVPDVLHSWDHVETLQNEVAFGKVISPNIYLISFVGVSIICGFIIFIYRKRFN